MPVVFKYRESELNGRVLMKSENTVSVETPTKSGFYLESVSIVKHFMLC